MDVKYILADWEKMQSGLKNLFGLGDGKGTIPELKNLNKNLEKAESDIAKHDSDGVISFTHTDRERTYQGLWEDFSVLYQFTGKVGDIVDRTIDQPFYIDMDAFVSEIQQLSPLNYTTTNRIGATTTVHVQGYQSMEVPKQEISMEDLLNGDNFYSEQMKLEYEAWKEMNVDQDITQAEYQLAALNTRAFGYESIKDGQLKKEFWANIAALVVIVGVSLICPPAGITLGAIYGTAELTSAISGKDWVSGRELDTGERVLRGVLAPVDILPAGIAVRSFSGAARTTRVGTGLKDLGINIKTSVKTSVNNAEIKILELNDFVATAAKQSEMRLKNANAVVKERVKEIPNKLANKAIDTAKVVDETVTNTKTAFSPKREFAFDGGVVKQSTENTHAVENSVTKIVGRIPGVNIGGSGGARGAGNTKGKFSFDATSEMKGFKHQITSELQKHDLSLDKFHELRLKPVSELTGAELKAMKQIRDAVPPITQDTLLHKTIPIKDIERYLSGEFTEIGGYVAKVEDVADIRMYDDVVESSRLDYTSWDGTRPYPEGGDSYAMIRFKTSKIDQIEIPYGERFGGINTDGPPCTLNGFTGARNGEIIPEFQFNGRYLPENGAELYKVINGKEILSAVYDSDLKVFVPVQ